MVKSLEKIWYFLFKYPVYKISLGKLGRKAWLKSTQIDGHKNIAIGNSVYINTGGWLAALPFEKETHARLEIGDGTYIGRYCHIYATSFIEIGKKVLMADKVYIADNLHSYMDVSLPVIDQPVKQTKKIYVGDGAWLGENVCIIGASVGKNSVVGANAVVTTDVPDYCVAVGSPAFIIKRYDFESKHWRKTDKQGNFIA
jgi:acetyltransferase-like isoleucine patch superfamily enzyme